jgi:hypothetical protein
LSIGSGVGGGCDVGLSCPGQVRRPSKAGASNTQGRFPACQSWPRNASGSSEAHAGRAAAQGRSRQGRYRPLSQCRREQCERHMPSFWRSKALRPNPRLQPTPLCGEDAVAILACRCARTISRSISAARLTRKPLDGGHHRSPFMCFILCSQNVKAVQYCPRQQSGGGSA